MVPASPEQLQRDLAGQREVLARQQLEDAQVAFERGAFERAVNLFEGILTSPVALRSADDLHEGFLYWGFTLFLMGDRVGASDKLLIALRLKPTFAPSPVTTRPDLLRFYEDRQAAFVETGGIQRLPAELFPELNTGAAVVKTQRYAPIPLAGIRLRQIGRRGLGDAFFTLELTGLLLHLASWGLYAAQFRLYTPTGEVLADVKSLAINLSGGLFYSALASELIVTAALDPKFPPNRDRAFRRLSRDELIATAPWELDARRRAPVRLHLSPAGVTLVSW